MLFQLAYHVGNRRCFLPNGNVDTFNTGTFLVDDGINRNRCFTGLAVTNDQFALATTNWHHRINRFQTNLYWLVDRLTFNYAGRNFFNRRCQVSFNRTLAVDGVTQGVNDATQQSFTYRYFKNAAGTFGLVTFGDVLVSTQYHRTDRVGFKV